MRKYLEVKKRVMQIRVCVCVCVGVCVCGEVRGALQAGKAASIETLSVKYDCMV